MKPINLLSKQMRIPPTATVFLPLLLIVLLMLLPGTPKELAVAVVGGSFVLLAGIASASHTSILNKEKELDAARISKQSVKYEELLQFFHRIVDRRYYEEHPEQRQRDLDAVKFGLAGWASPGTIKAFLGFRRWTSGDTIEGLIAVENIIREMRRDLGFDDKEVPEGEFFNMFVDNPNYLATTDTTPRGQQPLSPTVHKSVAQRRGRPRA